MFRCLGLVVLLFACCGADYEKCVEECKLDEEHKFSDHEQDVCRSADFQSKFIESSNAKCGQPVETIVKLNAPPGVTYTPVAVKVKRCRGPCKKGELICKPSAGATSTVTFHVRTEQESGKGCGTVVVEEHQACECDCSKNSNHCKENQEYDMDACECKCKNEDEMSQCEMEAIKEWEHESCSCKCRNVEECDAMHEWSEKDCKEDQIELNDRPTPALSNLKTKASGGYNRHFNDPENCQGQNRMSNLFLMIIEKNLLQNLKKGPKFYDSVVDIFAEKNCRINLMYK